MSNVDKWVTGLTFVGVLMFFVFNAGNVTKLGSGLASDAVQYVGGIATVGGGKSG